ncbi:hypothetical protein B7463_g10027, partial [Scytalidium lignicola]
MRLMQWKDEAYLRKDENGNFVPIEEYERRTQRISSWLPLSRWEVKLLAITGVGFFLDSYDLFIINLVTPVWTYEYWGGLTNHPRGGHYPPGLRGLVNAGAQIGNIFGQLGFGFLGDTLGRIGIGGDYPMSASIVAERGHLNHRGALLGWIFSNQGWGTLAGSIVTIVVLACFEPALNMRGEVGQIDAIWRIQMGLALVPALLVLPFRLTMPEGRKYLESKELNYSLPSLNTSLEGSSPILEPKPIDPKVDSDKAELPPQDPGANNSNPPVIPEPESRKAKWDAFIIYFSEWRHLKILIGTALSWFLLDIAFYGTNLNQSVILADIGFTTGRNEYHTLMRNAQGNLIVAVAGYVPGYFVTIALVERIGRKWIQVQGFLVCALLFGVLAGDYAHLSTAARFVLFALAQFFFNFGPNATTFIIPAEVFPSRVRGTAHGLSAATGRIGSILAALLFNFLSSNVIGLANVLWIFFACNLLGAVVTLLFLPETKGRDADLIDWEEIQEARKKKAEEGTA